MPDTADWNDLVQVAGGRVAGKKLKSQIGWDRNRNETDVFGFSALPGGLRDTDGSFGNVGSSGIWWSATEYDASYAYYRNMYSGIENVGEYDGNKSYGFATRCLQE